MRCKICKVCNLSNSINKTKCWREWQLCGTCGVKKHPDEYPSRMLYVAKGKGFSKKVR